MLTPEQKKEIQAMVDLATKQSFRKKIGDTPTDNLQLVNKKYTNLNGTVANRPIGSVASTGQRYFATDTNIPMTFNGTNWRDGVGSIVASN